MWKFRKKIRKNSEKSGKLPGTLNYFWGPPKMPTSSLLLLGFTWIYDFTRNSWDLRSLSRSRNLFILRKNTAPRFEQEAVQQQLFSCSYYSWVEQETDKQLFCCSFLLLFLKQVVDLHFSAVFLLLLFLCWNRKLTCSCSPSSAPKNQPN